MQRRGERREKRLAKRALLKLTSERVERGEGSHICMLFDDRCTLPQRGKRHLMGTD